MSEIILCSHITSFISSRDKAENSLLALCCTAHEIVEVDGFVFKRKRPAPKASPRSTEDGQPADKKQKLPATTHDTQPLPAQGSATPAPSSAPPATEAVVTPGIASLTTPDASVISAATTALLEQLPPDMAEPDRLASLCELLCAAELDELSSSSTAEQQLDPAVAEAVRDVLGTFVRSIQSSAAAGAFQV